MKINQAFEIIKELNEKYPDCNLGIFLDGQYIARGLSLHAISPPSNYQIENLKSNSKKVIEDADKKPSRVKPSVFEEVPF